MKIADHWETIVNTLQDALLVVDSGGKILFLNLAAERMTGYRSVELVGASCRTLNCTGCKIFGGAKGEAWCSLYSTGDVKGKRCLISNKQGRSIHVVKNASVLRNAQGKILGGIEILSDLSEVVRVQQEVVALRRTCQYESGYFGLIGEAPVMQRLFDLIDTVAQTEAPVMIQGPSGTGKELVARAIHNAGPRREKPFIKVNCAALNPNLLESELFGHVKGAYTGADRYRIGRFEAAHEGTLFLDEIGDIPPAVQVKLLRVLEEKEIERVGDHRSVPVDVRIITATNKDLERLTAENAFREDLFFRINVFPVYCPSLAERREDIPLLVQHFIHQNSVKSGKFVSGLLPEAIQALNAYPWPGNIRELRNAIEYAFVLCKGEMLGLQHLPPKITGAPARMPRTDLDAVAMLERDALTQALRECGGNQSKAAHLLGVSRVTVWKRMKRYGVDLKSDPV